MNKSVKPIGRSPTDWLTPPPSPPLSSTPTVTVHNAPGGWAGGAPAYVAAGYGKGVTGSGSITSFFSALVHGVDLGVPSCLTMTGSVGGEGSQFAFEIGVLTWERVY